METAMTLVGFDESEEKNLTVSEEALQKIQNVPTNYGIKTMAIVGPGRIGKSSLLNWLVGKNVFKIGSKTTRVTKGIWMYIDEDPVRNLANIYIDVEGFGDPLKPHAAENDNRLLNIVIQICDVVLYNIKGVYDSDMRDKIECVCRLFQRYRKANAVLEKPILVSVLRDFDLDQPECPDNEFKNLFRKNPELLDTFRQTKAFTLLKPKEGRVLDLANTPDTELCKEFIQERNEIKKYLTENTKPLRAKQKMNITGIVLAENIRKTVQHVNNDDLRMLSKSIAEILKQENEEIKKTALENFKTEMMQKWPLPSQPETLMVLFEREMEVALKYINNKCFPIPESSVEIHERAFKDEMENMFEKMQKDKCEEALASAVSKLKLNREEYDKDGGLDRFVSDYRQAEKTYEENRNLGPKKLDVWQKFDEGMEPEKESIQNKAKVRDMEKKAAASETENKELIKTLEKKNKELEDKSEKIKESEKEYRVFRGVMDAVKIATDCGIAAAETYGTITSAKAKSNERVEVNINTPSGSRSSMTGASSKSSSKGASSKSSSKGASSKSSSKGGSSKSSSKDTEV